MAKFFIARPDSGERVPFLRGILVQSLVSAGLTFKDAYGVAQMVRDRLGDAKEISTTDLRLHVAGELEERFGTRIREAYELGTGRIRPIRVRRGSRTTIFSVGLITHSLEACAISSSDAFSAASRAQQFLRDGGHEVVDHLELRRIIYQSLREQGADAAADRYLSWRQFRGSGDPLILLVGGTPGTGKSTMASELAYRLSIVPMQSTDMMRELIRCYLGRDAAPTLGYSSFEAWRGLADPDTDVVGGEPNSQVVKGFLSQFRAMKAGLEATIQRAVKERQDLIVDGVHVLSPGLDLKNIQDAAVVVPIMLLVATKEELAGRFEARGEEQPGREASRYLEHIDAIWELQSFLLNQADSADIPLIINGEHDETVVEILTEISLVVEARYPPDPKMLT